MSFGASTQIPVDIHVENALEANEDGDLEMVTYLFPGEDENGVECRLSFREMIDELIEEHRDDFTGEGLRQIFDLSHELARAAELLADVGQRMQDAQAERE